MYVKLCNYISPLYSRKFQKLIKDQVRYDNTNQLNDSKINFLNYLTVDEDLKNYLSNPNLKVRVVVDRGRRGVGHQAAAITAINRLYEMGFNGKLEILTSKAVKGKEKFLEQLSGLNVDIEKKIEKQEKTIKLNENITLRTRASDDHLLNGQIIDSELLTSLDQVDLVIFPANDITARSSLLSKFQGKRGIMSTPTNYFAVDFDSIITKEETYESKELNQSGILHASPKIKSLNEIMSLAPIMKIFESLNTDNKKFNYVNIYGAEEKSGFTDKIIKTLDKSLDRNPCSTWLNYALNIFGIKTQKPLIIFLHKHSSHPASIINKTMKQEELLNLISNNQPLPNFCVVELEKLPKECFDFICANSDLLVAESSNTLQLALDSSRPFIPALSRAFFRNVKISDEIRLSQDIRQFERYYLELQDFFQLSNSNIDQETASWVLNKIINKDKVALDYFETRKNCFYNKPCKISSLLRTVINKPITDDEPVKKIKLDKKLVNVIESHWKELSSYVNKFDPEGCKLLMESISSVDLAIYIQNSDPLENFFYNKEFEELFNSFPGIKVFVDRYKRKRSDFFTCLNLFNCNSWF